MPARAANPSDEDRPPTHAPATPSQPGMATVVSLASRRPGRGTGNHDAPPATTPNMAGDLTSEQRATQHWARVLEDAGLDLADQTVAATVQAVAGGLERLVGGLLVMREGGGPRNVEPMPWRGVDAAGAEELCGLLRELRRAPEVVAEERARVPVQGR